MWKSHGRFFIFAKRVPYSFGKYETDHKHAMMAGGEVDDMDLQKNIAYNLKKIRQQQNISLDMLADQTGVSKSMLGQIERGEEKPVSDLQSVFPGGKEEF